MHRRNLLSYKFNMSLGFSPAILSMLLYEWRAEDISIYMGAMAGLLGCLYMVFQKRVCIPNLLLYSTTGMLTFFSIFSFWIDLYCPPSLIPLTLEIITLLPPAILFINRKNYLAYNQHHSSCNRRFFTQGAEAALVSSKIVLILGFIHFLLISSTALIQHPMNDTLSCILFQILPPILLTLSIVLNQLGIYLFNKLTTQDIYERTASQGKKVIPTVRIAIATQGMMYLKPRNKNSQEEGKNDLPIEGILIAGETLEQGVGRLLKQFYPTLEVNQLQCHLKYHTQNPTGNQLVYLFLIDLKDDSLLTDLLLKGGKLWTTQQIENNLNKQIFSSNFEHEYDYLKTIIYTREKYKESSINQVL